MLRQKLSKEERRTRSHRLIVRGAVSVSYTHLGTAGDKEADDFCIRQLLPNKLKDQYCFKTCFSIAAIQSSFASNVFSSPSSFARITRHFSFSPGCRSSQLYSPSKICFSFHMIYAPYWDSEIHSCSSFIPFCNI